MRQYPIIRAILLPLTIFVAVTIPLKAVMPIRLTLVDFWNSGLYAYYTELAVGWAFIFIYAFFFGWTTSALLGALWGDTPSTRKIFAKFWTWFPRSVAIVAVWWGVIWLIALLDTIPYLPSYVLQIVLYGLWTTLTYPLYFTVIASPKPILRAFADGFYISVMSVNRWFHWFLLLFFVSGGFVYIWIPLGIAQQYLPRADRDMHGWMIHFQMLGGYSFEWSWLADYSRALLAHPPEYVYSVLFVLSVLVATAVNIRVAKILFANGYLPVTGTGNTVSSEL